MSQSNEQSADVKRNCVDTLTDHLNYYTIGNKLAASVAKLQETCDAPTIIDDDEPNSDRETERNSAMGGLANWLSDTDFIKGTSHYQAATNAYHLQLPPRIRSDIGPSRNQAGCDQPLLSNSSLCDRTKTMSELSEWLSYAEFEEEEGTESFSHPSKRQAPSRNNSCPVEESLSWQEPSPITKRAKYIHQPREHAIDSRSLFQSSSSIERSVNSVHKRASSRRVTFSEETPDEPNQIEISYNSCIPTNSKRLILEESDKAVCTRYFYEVMKQMQSCSFRKSDAVGKHQIQLNGYRGLECMHCQGKCMNLGRFFPRKVKTFTDRTKSIDTFYNHLVKCTACPDEIKDILSQLKESHAQEIVELKAKGVTKSQKVFLDRIWTRLHSSDV